MVFTSTRTETFCPHCNKAVEELARDADGDTVCPHCGGPIGPQWNKEKKNRENRAKSP